jgi:O-antigen/teichoic acid export membrane protein
MTAAVRSGSSTFRDAAIVLSTTALGLAGSLATQSCLAWFLEPAGRGAFAVCVTFASVAAVVFGLATDRAVQYHLIARELPLGRATATAFTTVLAGAALASAIGWILIGSSHPFFTKAEPASFRLALLLIPLTGLNVALGLLLAGVGRFATMGALNLVAIAAGLVLTVLFVGLGGGGVDGAIWALALAYALTVALQSRAVLQGTGPEWPRLADLRKVLSYGVRFYVARLGNVVNVQIGTIVMAWLATPAQIGVFAAASVLINRVMVIPDSIGTALQPRVGPDANGQPELVAAAARASLATVGVILAALLASAWWVVPILLSAAFSDAVSLLWWMAPGMWLKAATKPTTSYFIGINRPGVVSLSVGVEVVTNAVAMLLLYRRFGLVGAAIATTLAGALASLVLAVAFEAVSGLGLARTWRLRRADFLRVEDAARRFLGRAAPGAGAPGDASRFRRTELLPGRVVKHRRPELIAVEAEKTARAVEIGAATGLFRAPFVLAADAAGGTLATERFDDLVPLHEILLRGPGAEPLLAQAGRALAAIHRDLALPAGMRRPLPAPWAAPEADVDVALHGDFNTLNLFVRRGTGDLVVTDWETSYLAYTPHDPVAREMPTTGPRYFDLAWFVASLFRRTWFGFGRIADAPGCAEIFLRSYFVAAGPAARPEGFARYLATFPEHVAAAEAVIGVSWRYRLRHPRAQTVSYAALKALAQSLAARRPERVWRSRPKVAG